MPHIRRKRAYCICVHEFGYLKKKKRGMVCLRQINLIDPL